MAPRSGGASPSASRSSSTVMVMAIRQSAMIVALVAVMFVREWRLTLIALLIVVVVVRRYWE